ncbi:hypothetical protein [Streptomyces sp. NPDC052225]|uniref:hypothetical protein n=1 Tax=Streptomyces sp. NPDC052225 TaxID=3154949 RepID=UPI0034309346
MAERRLVPRRRVIALAALAMVLIAGAATALAVGGDEGGHLAANRAQLKRACAGMLPYEELRPFVPDAVAGRVDEYGTELEPGEQSRSAAHCTVAWPGHGEVRVTAVPVLSELPDSVEVEDLAPGEYGPEREAPGLTGTTAKQGGVWLLAECPAGLRGQVRPTGLLHVDAAVDLPRAGTLADFRTAVHVANKITARQKCGGSPLKKPDEVVDPYEAHVTKDYKVTSVDEPGRDQPKCRGLGARTGFPGKWTAGGDLQGSRLLSVCTASADTEDPADWDVTDITAASWAGEVGDSAYDQYRSSGDTPDFQDGRRDTTVPQEDGGAALDLWARAQCAAGPTYHRVTARFAVDGHGFDIDVSKARRAELSTAVRKVLDAYLDDPAAWPRQQRCHDTKLIGEVEEWQ